MKSSPMNIPTRIWLGYFSTPLRIMLISVKYLNKPLPVKKVLEILLQFFSSNFYSVMCFRNTDKCVTSHTAWEVSVFGVLLVCIFPHSDWIRRDNQYISPYSVRMRKNPDPKNAKCGHISRSDSLLENKTFFDFNITRNI